MKNIIKSARITLVFCLLLSVGYVSVLWLFAHVASPGGGDAETVTADGKVVGACNIGQRFTQDRYFRGRPSCAGGGYDAASSGASNKAATNEEYLAAVAARIDTFLVHHPYLKRSEVPSEMVTAGASGLDPDITPACAYVQVKRVANARGWTEEKVQKMVCSHIEKPLWGLFGPEKINVLKLNVALDKADKQRSGRE